MVQNRKADKVVQVQNTKEAVKIQTFWKVDHVLRAYGSTVRNNVKWSAFRSKFTGPHIVIVAKHPYYELLSESGNDPVVKFMSED